MPLPDIGAATNLKTSAFSLKDFIGHLVPKSAAEAMANNEILQIVVFSIFCGCALAMLGEKARALVQVIEQLAEMMLKVTGMVMKVAPLAVFAAMASTVTTQGLGILLTFAKFMGCFYLALAVLWLILLTAGFLFLGARVFGLVKLIRSPFLLAFSTASSEAAYPQLLNALDRFGVKRKISSFVLPLGYSFNLDGSMIYCTFAVLFIAQAYSIQVPLGTQISMLLLLMLTSKGMAGVPRA
jgi:Na+/H+-dicarboxylate symporter